MNVAYIMRSTQYGGDLQKFIDVLPQEIEHSEFYSKFNYGTGLIPLYRNLKGFDIVHINCPIFAGFANSIRRPVVTSVHTLQPDESKYEYHRRFFMANYFERKGIIHSDKLLACSPFIAGRIKEVYNEAIEKTVVIPHSVSYLPLRDEPPTNPPIVFASGRLAVRKNFTEFIHLSKSIKKELPDVEFYLSGGGREYKHLSSMNDGSCYILGRTSTERYLELLSSSFCYVLTSLYEGDPQVVIEAMSVGVPVFTHNLGFVHGIIKDYETGFLYDTPQEFLEKFLYLLNSPMEYENIVHNAREYAESRPSAEDIAKRFVQVYEEFT